MTHRILFAENIPAFENVASLDQLPATGSMVVALPMKIKNGSGGPLRIVAPDSSTQLGTVFPPSLAKSRYRSDRRRS